MGRPRGLLMAVTAATGGVVYGLLWVFETVGRHELIGGAPDLDMRLTVVDGFAFLGVLAALLVAVHVSLWSDARRPDLDEHGERRVTHLDTYALMCGLGASCAGVATVTTALGDGTLTAGAIGVAFAAAMVVVLAADASLAVQADLLQRDGRRAAREQVEALRAVVEGLGSDGPGLRGACVRLLVAMAAAAVGGLLVAVVLRSPDPGVRLIDGLAPTIAIPTVLAAVGAVAVVWWGRRSALNLLLVAPAAPLLLAGLLAAWAPAVDWADLAAGLLVGFVAPLAGGVLSACRRSGSLRGLGAIWFRRELRQAEAVVSAGDGAS